MTEYWSQVENARIIAHKPGGIESGSHELEVKLMLRVPYLPIGPNHTYMPLDSCDKATVEIVEGTGGKYE